MGVCGCVCMCVVTYHVCMGVCVCVNVCACVCGGHKTQQSLKLMATIATKYSGERQALALSGCMVT